MEKYGESRMLLSEYFEEWIEVYKVGAVRPVTLNKYYINLRHIKKLAPRLRLSQLSKRSYQKLLNDYALTHERQTTMDFHHQLKGCILDAMDEGLLSLNPTRKVIIKGKEPSEKPQKYLSQFEVQLLIQELKLEASLNWDWFILLTLKTGLRFSEALGLTPEDFNFQNQQISITKTWDYKSKNGGFQPTKNRSSNRLVQLDWQTAMQFSQLIKDLPVGQPVFVKKRVFNSTINKRLEVLCQRAGVPKITVHGLRHTHASLLIFADVSIATIAKRLGHSNMTTTQSTYLHIIQELENKDNDKIVMFLSTLM